MTQRVLYEGRAIGGPLDGDYINSRFAGGLVVISRAHNLSGLYRYTEESTFVYQEDNSYIQDEDKLNSTAEGVLFDIRSV